jgi:hypothetical protein
MLLTLINGGVTTIDDQSFVYNLHTLTKSPSEGHPASVVRVGSQWTTTKFELKQPTIDLLDAVYRQRDFYFTPIAGDQFFKKMIIGRPYMLKAYYKYLKANGREHRGYRALYMLLEGYGLDSVTLVASGTRFRYYFSTLTKVVAKTVTYEPVWDKEWDIDNEKVTILLDALFFKHPITWKDQS